MKFIVLVFTSFCATLSFAFGHSTFLLKGNVKNFHKDYFEFGTTGYFESCRSSIIVNKKGNFSREIYVDGVQDVKVIINNELLTFSASPGDTINLDWDANKLNNTLRLTSPSISKSKELYLALLIHKQRFKPYMDLRQKLFTLRELPDSSKYKLINESYNAEMSLIASAYPVSEYNAKAFYDAYFKHAALMKSIHILNNFTLETDPPYLNPKYLYFSHTTLSAEAFRCSAYYREFIFDWVRSYMPFNYLSSDESAGTIIFNPAKREYLLGEANISIPLIRDWFLASSIISSFRNYQYTDVKPLYDQYLVSGGNKSYIDTVKTFFKSQSLLKPGMPAPQFTLKDAGGRSISLSEFQGKVVYTDFWGVYCGPCIGDITENATLVHKKYKNKNVVFLNICVDEKGELWKKKIVDLKLEGINLIADGWATNQVCKDYNIKGIPHYVIIDQNGNIFNNNADGLHGLIGDGKNMLDKALENLF